MQAECLINNKSHVNGVSVLFILYNLSLGGGVSKLFYSKNSYFCYLDVRAIK